MNEKLGVILKAIRNLEKVVEENLEGSREKALVKTKIDEARLWAKEAIEKQNK